MPDEIRDKIDENARGPRRVRTEAGEVEAQNLRDQIEADRYLAGKDAVTSAANRTKRGLRFNKIIPPGSL
jgi:hypothetical protein